MKRFIYKICYPDRSMNVDTVNVKELNKYGENGWEAIAVLDDERVLMKRE